MADVSQSSRVSYEMPKCESSQSLESSDLPGNELLLSDTVRVTFKEGPVGDIE